MDIKILLCGHAGFGTGLHGALRLLCGDDKRVDSLDFLEGDSFDNLVDYMEAFVSDDVGGLRIICTDVQGGSPFKASLLIQMKHPDVRVVTGVNFPLLVELLYSTDCFGDVDALLDNAVDAARGALLSVELQAM